jgi:protein TonB
MEGSVRPVERGSWQRLGVAMLASAALHAWLAFGLPVKAARTQGVAGPVIEARLMAATPSAAPVPSGSKAPAHPPDVVPEVAEAAPEPAHEAPPPVVTRADPPPVEGPPGIPVPQIEDTEFYPARQLDQYPKPVAEVGLKYPRRAGTEVMSGTVTLLLLIDDLGIVVEATVVEADPPGYFEDAAIEAFKAVLFTPGQRDGRVVKSRLVVQVAFDAQTESLRR